VRSEKSLKGLLPDEEATFTISGIEIGDKESPEVSITSDKLLKDVTIPYKASLDGSEKPIEGTVDEKGSTAIKRPRIGYSNCKNCTSTTDIKGRTDTHKARGAYFPTSKQ
jgi:hypothetical protein